MLKYFNYEEFDSPDVQGSGQMMDYEFLELLDDVRDLYGKPMVITSGYRTQQYNETLKHSSKHSSHCKGLAADIAVDNSKDRFRLIYAAIEYGVPRIGIGKNFVHLDCDFDKPTDVMWHYYE